MLYGANIWNWQQNKIKIGGLTAVRYYFPPTAGVPSAWPALPPGLTGLVSIRPPLTDFAAGNLDTETVSFLRTAPPGSWIAVWHEANQPKKNIDPAVFRMANAHMNTLISANRIPVRLVQIFETYPVTADKQNLVPWVQQGMWAYLLDGYQLNSETPAAIFDSSIAAIKTVAPRARIGIAETNSLTGPDTWADIVFDYALAQKMKAFLFFSQDASAPPPVFPVLPSDAVMAQLAITAAQS